MTRKKELFDCILRLRRAGRDAPENRDLAAVRAFLERELGETVSQRLAAEILGISHTGLARWINNRDVPTVYTPTGRTEIPVNALLDLYEQVEGERSSGRRRRHVLEPGMLRARESAERLPAGSLLSSAEAGSPDGHRRAELRSLAYHRALARRLRRSMVDEARQVVWKWRAQGHIDPRYADEWETLLERPLPEIRTTIAEDSPKMRDLRQNSPFAGMLSEPERRRILSTVQ